MSDLRARDRGGRRPSVIALGLALLAAFSPPAQGSTRSLLAGDETAGWRLVEVAVGAEPWQTARSVDKLLLLRPSSSADAPGWVARLVRSADGPRGELLTLASLHRRDGLAAEARLRAATSLLDRTVDALGSTEPVARLLDFEPPVDLADRHALAAARLARRGDRPDEAERALLRALGDDLEAPAGWCDEAVPPPLAPPLSAVTPLTSALCRDELPDWENGPAAETADALLRLGTVRYRRGDTEAAQQALRSLADRADAPLRWRCPGARLLARSRERAGDDDRAVEAYTWALDHCQDDDGVMVGSLFGLGRACVARRDRSCAETHLERLITDYPEASHVDDALFELAELYRRLGDGDAREAMVERALGLETDGDMWRELVWRDVRDHLEAGREARAEALLGRAIEAFDWDATYYSQGRFETLLGHLLAARGDLAGAASAWNDAVTRYPLTFYASLACAALESISAPCPWPERRGPTGPVAWPLGGCLEPQGRWLELVHAGFWLDAAAAIAPHTCPEALWIRAMLLDRGGRYAVSHDIPRRLIPDWQREVGGDTDRRWALAFPRPWLKQVQAEGRRGGVEVSLVYAVMREESGFRSAVHSYAGAQGLMQLMPRTARGHAEGVEGEITVARLGDPAVNIRIGVNVLAHLAHQLDGQPILMVAAYNAGRGAVGRWLRERPFDHASDWPGEWIEAVGPTQTRNYTKRVLSSLEVYRYLYE